MEVRRVLAPTVAITLAIVAIAAAGSDARGDSASQRRPRVVFVSDEPGCSNSFAAIVCGAFTSALRRAGVDGRAITPTEREDMVATLSLIARQRYDLVIGFGSEYFNAVSQVARQHPDVRFVMFDEPRSLFGNPPANVSGITFRTGEAAYLAGWLAGKLETRRAGPDVVGVVGGMAIPGVTGFVAGFKAGARRASPGIKVLVDYSNDFVDASKCTALARSQIAKGAGAVFDVAGECGLGALEAAKAGNVWGIGVDSDMSSLGPHILTSVFKRFDVGFLTLLRQLQTDRIPRGKDTVLTLRGGAVGLGRISPKVPTEYHADLDRLRKQIIAGKIRVSGASP